MYTVKESGNMSFRLMLSPKDNSLLTTLFLRFVGNFALTDMHDSSECVQQIDKVVEAIMQIRLKCIIYV